MPGAYAATFVQLHSVFSFRFQPVNGMSSAREYELLGAAERTAKFTAYLEKVVTHAKIDYLRHMEKPCLSCH